MKCFIGLWGVIIWTVTFNFFVTKKKNILIVKWKAGTSSVFLSWTSQSFAVVLQLTIFYFNVQSYYCTLAGLITLCRLVLCASYISSSGFYFNLIIFCSSFRGQLCKKLCSRIFPAWDGTEFFFLNFKRFITSNPNAAIPPIMIRWKHQRSTQWRI